MSTSRETCEALMVTAATATRTKAHAASSARLTERTPRWGPEELGIPSKPRTCPFEAANYSHFSDHLVNFHKLTEIPTESRS